MASAYDKASLVMLPHAVKESKLYSVKPEDRSGDFTFSRGTDTATRVNASGLIEKERGNTAEHSNTFNQWANKTAITLTSGQSGYDGTNDAWLMEATGSSLAYMFDTPTINSGIRTRSIYAKQGTSSNVTFLWDSFGDNVFASFDLSDGTFTNAGCLANIEAIGATGWYRCISTITDVSNTYACLVSVTDETGSGTTSGDNVYIQDFQQESGLVATDYIETTTAAVYEGITDNLPRLDYHNPDSESPNSCPSLLLEPSRTNLIQHSEYFGGWSPQAMSVESNSITSPDGLNNASKVVPTATDAFHAIYNITVQTTSYVFSVFAKAGGYNFIRVYDQFSNNITQASFDLVNGTSVGGDIEPMGDGWYRCIAYGINPSANYNIPSFTPSPNGTDVSFTGDGTSGVYLWGAQVEAGSYPTSYIPTYGASASRAGDDDCSVTSAGSIVGNSSGTIFVEFIANNITSQTNDPVLCQLIDDGTASQAYIQLRDTGNLKAIYNNASGGIQANITQSSGTLADGTHKAVFAFSENSFAFYVDGVLIGTDTNGSVVDTFDTINLGYDTSTFTPSAGIKQFLYFPTRLTNAELAALTA